MYQVLQYYSGKIIQMILIISYNMILLNLGPIGCQMESLAVSPVSVGVQ